MESRTTGPIKFAFRFFILWNVVLFISLMLIVFFSLFIFSLYSNGFTDTSDQKNPLDLVVIIGIPLLNVLLGFPITYYFFQRTYARLAAAVSPDLPTTIPQQEMWKSWAMCYWFAPLSILLLMIFGIATRGQLNHRGLGVTILPVIFFITSFPVYLRLKYLAQQQQIKKTAAVGKPL